MHTILHIYTLSFVPFSYIDPSGTPVSSPFLSSSSSSLSFAASSAATVAVANAFCVFTCSDFTGRMLAGSGIMGGSGGDSAANVLFGDSEGEPRGDLPGGTRRPVDAVAGCGGGGEGVAAADEAVEAGAAGAPRTISFWPG